jgi:1,4-dihydroxy-2-naphthoate octaprenyltransferase
MEAAVDWYLVLIGILLIATLTAFFTGLFPYPFGVLLLLVLFGIRLMRKREKKRKQRKVTNP